MTHLHVSKEEIRDQTAREYRVVEHTKTNRDRYVPVIPKAIALLNRIKEQDGHSEYIVARDGERFHSRQVSHVLEQYAKENGAGGDAKHDKKNRDLPRFSLLHIVFLLIVELQTSNHKLTPHPCP